MLLNGTSIQIKGRGHAKIEKRRCREEIALTSLNARE